MTGPKVLTLDIETSPHHVDAWGLYNQNVALNQLREPSRMMCWAAKWHGNPKVEFRSEFHHGRQGMLDRAWKLVDEADILVSFNGDRFDFPNLRREWLLADFPPPSPAVSVDLLKVARRQFRFASNKLQHIAQQLGLGGKVPHTGHALWIDCLAGDRRAWSLMKRYCIGDVVLEEQVYDRLLSWIPNHPHVALFNPDGNGLCPRCGGTDVQKRGFFHTAQRSYQRYRCNNCKSWSRDATAVARIQMRGVA